MSQVHLDSNSSNSLRICFNDNDWKEILSKMDNIQRQLNEIVGMVSKLSKELSDLRVLVAIKMELSK